MSLRIGVVSGSQEAEWGGGWTLTAVLTAALRTAHTSHEFLFIDDFLWADSSKQQDAGAGHPGVFEAAQDISSDIPDAPTTREKKASRSTAFGSVLAAIASRITLRFGTVRSYFPKATKQVPRPYPPQSTPEELLEQTISRERLDLVWYMIPNAFPLSIPFIATVWDLEHRKQPYFPEVSVTLMTWCERELNYSSLLPRASAILTGTEVGKNEVVKYYGVNANNVFAIKFPAPTVELRPTAVSIRKVLKKYGINGTFLLYPAQFWPHKNHANLLMSLAVLRQRDHFRPNLVLTGSDQGNRTHVHNLIHKLDLSEQVFDLGFISREELNCLYAGAAALVFPSFFGPDNLPPLEAFALGCPVVAADVPGAREQLGPGALYFNPSDPEQIAARILDVCENIDCRRRLIEEGSVISRQRTPDAYISEVCKVLDNFEAVRRCWGERYEPNEAEVTHLRKNVGDLTAQLIAVEQSTSWRITKPLRQLSSLLRMLRYERTDVVLKQSAERGAEVTQLRKHVGDLTAQLIAVEQSTSWRITKPLRQVSSLLRMRT
jgi:glycosyltransferase involved in cell wall biosynthesis